MNKKIYGIFVCTLLILSLLPIAYSQDSGENANISNNTSSFRYDFIEHAKDATWYSGTFNGGFHVTEIPWGGNINDERGFACHRENIKLEDGKYYSKVLETHPKWEDNSIIYGLYPDITIPPEVTLYVRYGFLDGAVGSDGVCFYVRIDYYGELIVDWKLCDGSLGKETIYLGEIAGETVRFNFTVLAGDTSNQDWAVWLAACLYSSSTNEPPETPSKPQGPSSGKKGGTNSYKLSTEDYTLDKITYGCDWDGDKTIDQWTDYYNSKEIIEIEHTWDEEGIYEFSVKAKDEFGVESGWSEPLTVTISKTKTIKTTFLTLLENHPHLFPLIRQILE